MIHRISWVDVQPMATFIESLLHQAECKIVFAIPHRLFSSPDGPAEMDLHALNFEQLDDCRRICKPSSQRASK